jgi:[protein-PII] uridylyltransferase
VRLFNRFFKTLSKDSIESLVPVIGWHAHKDEGYSLIEVAGWNRRLLLAKVAGVLAARKLNILSADLFVRSDDLVLNVFRVCTQTFNPVTSEREIERIEKLIHSAFNQDEDDNVDVEGLIKKQEEPTILEDEPLNYHIPQRVYLSNKDHAIATVIEIQAEDRIGLLYDIFTTLGVLNASVINARISTQAGAAIDRFYIVDETTEVKITDPDRLSNIESQIYAVLSKKADKDE